MSQTVSVPIAAMAAGGLANQKFQLNVSSPRHFHRTLKRHGNHCRFRPGCRGSPEIYVSDAIALAASGATHAVFTVSLSSASASPITLIYGTGDGTATTASGAYAPSWGTLTFNPGQALSQTVAVPVSGLPVTGLPNQTFSFAVAFAGTNSGSGTIVRQVATGTIEDALPPPVVPSSPSATRRSKSEPRARRSCSL